MGRPGRVGRQHKHKQRVRNIECYYPHHLIHGTSLHGLSITSFWNITTVNSPVVMITAHTTTQSKNLEVYNLQYYLPDMQ